MKVKILQKFHDKADYMRVYLVGETFTFDDARAEYLIGLGLVEAVKEAKKAEPVVKPAEEPKPLFSEDTLIQPVTTTRRRTQKDN